MYDFDVYQGAEQYATRDSAIGISGGAVMKMIRNVPEQRNHKIFADNFFSSITLASRLRSKGIYYTGTIRNNRIPKDVNLKSEQQLKKESRVSFDYAVHDAKQVALVRWHDNHCVTLVSTLVGVEPVGEVRRFSQQQKRHIQISCPAVVSSYNRGMGGVDLCDSLCNLYRSKLWSKRWYLNIFFYPINLCCNNAWILCRRDCLSLIHI